MRFRPPPITSSPELAWVLTRAFGPPGAAAGGPFDARGATALTGRLDLLPRIASRLGVEALARELGGESDVVELFRDAHRQAAAKALVLAEAVRALSEAAATVEAGAALLKGAALGALRVVDGGSRNACDVDVLVATGSGEALAMELSRRGFNPAGRSYEHQLPASTNRLGATVEIHRVVLGVRISGPASATFETLESAGLLSPAGDTRLLLPSRDVLLAHLLVHGLAQHGLTPEAYPPLRLLCDLVDLKPSDAEVTRALGWIRRDVSEREGRAAVALARRLAAGAAPLDVAGEETGEALLFRHLLAAALDDEYARSLKLLAPFSGPTDRPRAVHALLAAWHAIALSRDDIDAIYGPPRSRLGYLGRRLLRPFDLLARAARSLGARRRES